MWLSKSGVQMWEQCPFRWYHQEILKTDFEKSGDMYRGNLFHDSVFELYDRIKKEEIDGVEKLEAAYNKYFWERTQELTKQGLAPEMAGELEVLFKKFVVIEKQRWTMQDRTEEKWKKRFWPVHKELYLEDEGIKYYGTFDRVDKVKKGQYIIIDYKTGTYKEYNASKIRNEMWGYRHLIEKNGLLDGRATHWAQIYLSGIDPQAHPYILSEAYKEQTGTAFYKKLDKVRKAMRLQLYPKKGRNGPLCQWCPYMEQCFLEKEDKWREPE